MSNIMERYSIVQKRISEINERYKAAERHLSEFKEEDDVVRQARIENLDKQLKDIGPYYARVEYFRQLAEKNITSKNILSLKALELDFNSLRHDAARIDPQNPNDPYAYRLYVHTRCNEIYLEEKQKEFEAKKEQLINGKNEALELLKEQVKKAKESLEHECYMYIRSAEFDEFANQLQTVHFNYSDVLYMDSGLQGSRAYELKDKTVSFGAVAQPLIVLGDDAVKAAKLRLGKYYDEKSQSVLLPVEYDSSNELFINIKTVVSKENRCFKGISNLLLNLIKRTKPGNRKFKISFIDAVHFNNSQLKALRPLENSAVIDKIPVNDEEVIDQLGRIVASFMDIDEKLQDYESVSEYNANVDDDKDKIERRVVCLVGYPDAFDTTAKNFINRIINNHQRYGITVLLVNNTGFDNALTSKENNISKVSENFYNVNMPQGKSSTIDRGDETTLGFRWYEYDYKGHPIPEAYIDEIRLDDEKANGVVSEYIKLYPLNEWKYKDRDDNSRKKIMLPYGVDSEGNVSEVSFEAESFAAYLMGASGSGKSTLLHTIITGILKNYHPDDVELWLADFKMAEFSQYIDPMPPHVKYILLDESRELVFDLVDKLTNEMLSRQRYFMKHRDIKKVEDVPSDIYMPVIFVILDEFSIMSQVLESDAAYQLKLQNLLAKGRALGIKFIFSSQSFMTGIRGLTSTAKEQIQTRIAMHNNTEEITETLELPRFLKTEQNNFMIATLPVHMALRKYHKSENELVLERVNVLYFKGEAEEAYKPQRDLIQNIQKKLHKIDKNEFNGKSKTSYVDKHPVVVDGNSYNAFITEKQKILIEECRKANNDEISEGDVVVSFGSPRRMENIIFSNISNESRENMLIVAGGAEMQCAASLISTIGRSFEVQDGHVQIWAYSKNRIYKTYKDSAFHEYSISEGMDEICVSIRKIKDAIYERKTCNEVIVLLGMEQICSDFEFIDFDVKKDQKFLRISGDYSKYEPKTKEEIEKTNETISFNQAFEAKYNVDGIEDQLMDEGKSIEEISDEISRLMSEFAKGFYGNNDTETELTVGELENKQMSNENDNNDEDDDYAEEDSNAYNALEDFKYIVKQGSRFGYHFVFCINNMSDLRSVKIGLDAFRHRLAFQISPEDSMELFGSKVASKLPEHICQYSNLLDQYSLRPYIHKDISWDGWVIDENGKTTNI